MDFGAECCSAREVLLLFCNSFEDWICSVWLIYWIKQQKQETKDFNLWATHAGPRLLLKGRKWSSESRMRGIFVLCFCILGRRKAKGNTAASPSPDTLEQHWFACPPASTGFQCRDYNSDGRLSQILLECQCWEMGNRVQFRSSMSPAWCCIMTTLSGSSLGWAGLEVQFSRQGGFQGPPVCCLVVLDFADWLLHF